MRLDPSSKAILTVESTDPQSGNLRSQFADLDGNPLPLGAKPVTVLTDAITGKVYAKVADVKPTHSDASSQRLLEAIEDREPEFFDHPDAALRGWYAEIEDEDVDGQPAAADAKPAKRAAKKAAKK